MTHRQKKSNNYKKFNKKHNRKSFDLGLRNNSQMTAPKAYFIKENMYVLDFIKIKNFYFLKDSSKRMKRQAMGWKIVYAKHILDKSLNHNT